MACFLVSAAEAVVVRAVGKRIEGKETERGDEKTGDIRSDITIPMSAKLKWLSKMLCGGAVLLAFEHVWHGEVVPWFPFLTAMSDPADAMEMFREMATVGVSMAALVTAVWGMMCRVADSIVKKPITVLKKGTAL